MNPINAETKYHLDLYLSSLQNIHHCTGDKMDFSELSIELAAVWHSREVSDCIY